MGPERQKRGVGMCGTGRGWGGVRRWVGEQNASARFGGAQAALRREGGACRADTRAVAQWTRRQQHLLPAAPALRRRSARTSSERARAAVQQMVAQRPRGTSCWAWLLAVAQWTRRPRIIFPALGQWAAWSGRDGRRMCWRRRRWRTRTARGRVRRAMASSELAAARAERRGQRPPPS